MLGTAHCGHGTSAVSRAQTGEGSPPSTASPSSCCRTRAAAARDGSGAESAPWGPTALAVVAALAVVFPSGEVGRGLLEAQFMLVTVVYQREAGTSAPKLAK